MRNLIKNLRRHYLIGFLLLICGCILVYMVCSEIRKRRSVFWHKYEQVTMNMTPQEVEAILGSPDDTDSAGGGLSDSYSIWNEDGRRIIVTFGGGTVRVVDKIFLPRTPWGRAWHDVDETWDDLRWEVRQLRKKVGI